MLLELLTLIMHFGTLWREQTYVLAPLFPETSLTSMFFFAEAFAPIAYNANSAISSNDASSSFNCKSSDTLVGLSNNFKFPMT